MRNTRLKSVGASPSELFFRREMRNPLPNLPKELDLDTAILNKEMKSVDPVRKKIPSFPLKLGQRIEIQNVKSKRWDMRGTVMPIREGGASYYIHIDGDDKNVLRNRIFLRPLKESELPGGASNMEYGVLEEDQVVDSELHSPRPTSPVAQADAMIDSGSSSSYEGGAPCWRSNEADGEQRSRRKPTRVGREHPSTAAGHAQASPEYHRQAGSQPPHTSTSRHTGRITRSHTRSQRGQRVKKLRFELENEYFEYQNGQGSIEGD